MDIKQFAEKHRVKIRKDICGDPVIVGNRVANVYEGFDDARLGLYIAFPTARKCNAAAKALVGVGFTIRQRGDTELCATFDSDNEKQARIALKYIGARRIRPSRPPSPAQLAARAAFAERRKKPLEAVPA